MRKPKDISETYATIVLSCFKEDPNRALNFEEISILLGARSYVDVEKACLLLEKDGKIAYSDAEERYRLVR